MVRLDPEIYEQMLKRKGCAPMDFTGRPMRGFVFVARTGFMATKNLEFWLDRALEFNPKAKSSQKKNERA